MGPFEIYQLEIAETEVATCIFPECVKLSRKKEPEITWSFLLQESAAPHLFVQGKFNWTLPNSAKSEMKSNGPK